MDDVEQDAFADMTPMVEEDSDEDVCEETFPIGVNERQSMR